MDKERFPKPNPAVIYPRTVEGRLVVVQKQSADSQASRVGIITISQGAVVGSRHLYTLPGGVDFTVSPSAKYILWRHKGNDARGRALHIVNDARGRALHIVNVARGEIGSVNEIRHGDSVVSWSANGEAALYRHISPLGISYRVLHLPTATVAALPNKNNEEVQSVFWTRDDMNLVYSALPMLADKRVPLTDHWERHFFLTRASVKDRFVPLPPQQIDPSELSRSVGKALLPLMSLWEKENFEGYPTNDFTLFRARLLSLTPDGTAAVTYGKGIYKRNPTWAEPDWVTTYVVKAGHSYKFATPNDEIHDSVYWGANKTGFHYLSELDGKWVWINLSTKQSLRLALPSAWGTVVQVLP